MNPIIKEKVDSLQEEIKSVLLLERHADVALAIRDAFPDVNIRPCCYKVSIDIDIHTNDLAEITPILLSLKESGYSLISTCDNNDWRIYLFNGIRVNAYIHGGGKCKLIQTGVEKVPIIKILCDDEPTITELMSDNGKKAIPEPVVNEL